MHAQVSGRATQGDSGRPAGRSLEKRSVQARGAAASKRRGCTDSRNSHASSPEHTRLVRLDSPVSCGGSCTALHSLQAKQGARRREGSRHERTAIPMCSTRKRPSFEKQTEHSPPSPQLHRLQGRQLGQRLPRVGQPHHQVGPYGQEGGQARRGCIGGVPAQGSAAAACSTQGRAQAGAQQGWHAAQQQLGIAATPPPHR